MSVRGSHLVGIAVAIVLTCIAWAQGRDLAINEVAWAGSCEERTAEWVELHNASDRAVPLEGWRLASSDGAPDLPLKGTIPAHGFFLLARDDSGAIAGLSPDLLYAGALRDGGEALRLIAPDGTVADTANAAAGPWPAGTPEPIACSMERIDPSGPDVPGNWATSTGGFGPQGQESDPCGCGTPGRQNSATASPPQLLFSAQPQPVHIGEPVRFDATASVSLDGSPISFFWDFGDGETAEGQTASHTYEKAATYVASLTVRSEKGGWSMERIDVRVITLVPLHVDFSAQPSSRAKQLRSLDPIAFSDETHTPSGRAVAWSWDFGDGETAQGQTASHTYLHGGAYIVGLTVTDDRGERATQTQSLRIAGRYPVARFTAAPLRPNPGEPIAFDASPSFDPDGALVAYAWDFDGEGTVDQTASTPLATHVYPAGGDVLPTLWVTDDDPDGARQSLPFTDRLHVNLPPQAAFRPSILSPREAESVAFTDHSQDPDGSIVSWTWWFGDGATANSASAAHSYQKSGTYRIALTVTDDGGAQATVTTDLTVLNLPPVAALSANGSPDPLEVFTSTPVTFDASASHDPSPQGRIVRYEWDLDGDGTYELSGPDARVTHAYSKSGTVFVGIRVTDNAIDKGFAVSSPLRITVVDRPPEARFGPVTPADPIDNQPVQFTDASIDPDGTVTGWHWDFGDGTVSSVQHPAHRFPQAATYNVTLIATDNEGAASSPVTQSVVVRNARPIAAFTVSTTSPSAGYPIQFADRSSDPSPAGSIVHVAWDFGDGTTCPGNAGDCGDPRAPIHTYAAPGTYTVILVVIDNDGGLGRTTRTITVGE